MIQAFVPVFLGTFVYLAWREDVLLLFRWVEVFGLNGLLTALRVHTMPMAAELPTWFRFSLPDGLWLLGFMLLIAGSTASRTGRERLCWLVAPLALALGSEFSQALGLLEGTFDPMDVLCYLAATALAFHLARVSVHSKHSCGEGRRIDGSAGVDAFEGVRLRLGPALTVLCFCFFCAGTSQAPDPDEQQPSVAPTGGAPGQTEAQVALPTVPGAITLGRRYTGRVEPSDPPHVPGDDVVHWDLVPVNLVAGRSYTVDCRNTDWESVDVRSPSQREQRSRLLSFSPVLVAAPPNPNELEAMMLNSVEFTDAHGAPGVWNRAVYVAPRTGMYTLMVVGSRDENGRGFPAYGEYWLWVFEGALPVMMGDSFDAVPPLPSGTLPTQP